MIFVDTWAWIALAVKQDQYHAAVKTHYQQLRNDKRRFVTTNYVLSELITYLYKVTLSRTAASFENSVLVSLESGNHVFVYLSSDQFHRSWEMRQEYHDKPDISFVDFTSMIVM